MQSVNEELQSTNEELETSKEELQSINEELATVNSELQIKVADLSLANNDMNNLLGGAGIGTVFVDHGLKIIRFTPTASMFINLIQSDVGRPVAHIVSNLVGYSRLVADTQVVLNTLIPKSVDVQTTESKWFRMNIQPYRTLDNVIEGAVITFVDITQTRKMREALEKSEERLRLALSVCPVVVFNQDLDLRYTWIHHPVSGLDATWVVGKTDADLLPEHVAEIVTDVKQRVLESGKGTRQKIQTIVDGNPLVFDLAVEPLRDTDGAIIDITGVSMDISTAISGKTWIPKGKTCCRKKREICHEHHG
ncbi:MAG: PAS domain-containing protein [Desulfatirhabdiaceae bacterium]